MNFYTVVALGPVAVAVAVAAGWWWLRSTARRRQSMPPLVRRIPGLPRDGAPLDVYERYRLDQAEWALSRPTVPHPLEQSGDR